MKSVKIGDRVAWTTTLGSYAEYVAGAADRLVPIPAGVSDHPLHVEDCRHRGQRAKVEEGAGYIFVVLKPVHVADSGELYVTDLDLFLGRDYLITVQEGECPAVRTSLDQLRAASDHSRPDQLFYRVADGVVDAYAPVLDWFNETIDRIEDTVLEKPSPVTLQSIFESKRGLVELRRHLGNMRDVYDHLARNMDTVEMQRDLLSGAMDVYLSSVANRTNQVMKVLTVLGTVALPSIVISGIYGMNTKGLPWINSPYGSEIAFGLMLVATLGLLIVLKKFDWF